MKYFVFSFIFGKVKSFLLIIIKFYLMFFYNLFKLILKNTLRFVENLNEKLKFKFRTKLLLNPFSIIDSIFLLF